MPCLSSARVTRGQFSRRYCSLYLGKRVAKEDSSVNGFVLSSFVNGSTFHYSKSQQTLFPRRKRGWETYMIDIVCIPWFGFSVTFILIYWFSRILLRHYISFTGHCWYDIRRRQKLVILQKGGEEKSCLNPDRFLSRAIYANCDRRDVRQLELQNVTTHAFIDIKRQLARLGGFSID